MYKASDYAHAIAADIAKRRSVTFEFGQPAYSLPAVMDPSIRGRLNQIAQDLGIPTMDLASGGGHDATVFAACGVPTGMIFIRNDHGSHNPDEAMEMADFGLAAELLTAFITSDGARAESGPHSQGDRGRFGRWNLGRSVLLHHRPASDVRG
jgi:N-carbamoyl-L-amino-acid hydrolase